MQKSPMASDITESQIVTSGRDDGDKAKLYSAPYLNALVDGILNEACAHASTTLSMHSKFANDLKANILEQVFGEIKKIENLNKVKFLIHCVIVLDNRKLN